MLAQLLGLLSMYSQLNTNHWVYDDIIFALGLNGDNTQYINLKGGATVAAVPGNHSVSNDATYGKVVTMDNNGGINFGDVSWFDGKSAVTIISIQRSSVGQVVTANYVRFFSKEGGTKDTVDCLWQKSENFYVGVETSSGKASTTITDGLHDTNEEKTNPLQRHAVSLTFGSGAVVGRTNGSVNLQATPAAIAGTLDGGEEDYIIFPATTEDMTLSLYEHIVIDAELTAAEVLDLFENTSTLYSGVPAVLSAPTVNNISESSVQLGASTSQPTGYGTATGHVVIDTVANLTDISDQQIKDGQNASGGTPLKAGSLSITESPFTLNLSDISFTIGDTYGFAWLMTNSNGDSNQLTGQFTVAGISISSVTDPLIPLDVGTITANLVGTTPGPVVLTDPKGRDFNLNVTAWPTATGSGDIDFDIPDLLANDLYPGASVITVSTAAGDDSESVNVTLQLNTGWSYGVITGIEEDADAKLEANPAPQIGHSVFWQRNLRRVSDDFVTAHLVDVVLSKTTYKVLDSTPADSYYFDYSFYDEADNTHQAELSRRIVNLTQSDVIPEGLSLGDDIVDAEPGTVVIRPYTMLNVDPGVDIGVVAGGVLQFSIDQVNTQASVLRQLNEVYYGHFTVPAFGQSEQATVNANGVTDSITVSARDALPPIVTSQPQPVTVEVGDDATFTVAGDNIETVQWTIGGVDIVGATELTYTRTTVQGDIGVSVIAARISSTDGITDISQPADLTVAEDLTPPVFTQGLQASSIQTDGFSVGFTVNEDAAVYGICVLQGSAAPTDAQQIVDRVDYNGVTVLAAFNVSAFEDVARIASFSGIPAQYEDQPVTAYVAAVDAHGNIQAMPATLSTTVTLDSSTPDDVTPPVLTLLGENPYTLVQGTPFVEPGYQCIDSVDGDITDSVNVVGSVDHDTIGQYPITYAAADAAGNPVSRVRVVNVVADNEWGIPPLGRELTYDYGYAIAELVKDPDARNNYWFVLPGTLGSDSILSYEFYLNGQVLSAYDPANPDQVGIDGHRINGFEEVVTSDGLSCPFNTLVELWLKGGTPGERYQITMRYSTQSGNVDDKSVILFCYDR